MPASSKFLLVDLLNDLLALESWVDSLLFYAEARQHILDSPIRLLIILVVILCLEYPHIVFPSALFCLSLFSARELTTLAQKAVSTAESASLTSVISSKSTEMLSSMVKAVFKVANWGETTPKLVSELHVHLLIAAATFTLLGCKTVMKIVILASVLGYGDNYLRLTVRFYSNLVVCAVIMAYIGDTTSSTIDKVTWDSTNKFNWTVTFFENQRWWAGIGWSSELLSTDPFSYSDLAGRGLKSIAQYKLIEGLEGVETNGWKCGK